MSRQIVDRYRFSIPEVARAMLEDQAEDCERWDIRVEGGMVIIDVVEPASGRSAAPAEAEEDRRISLEAALDMFRDMGDTEFAELIEGEIAKRARGKPEEKLPEAKQADVAKTGAVASSFAKEVDAAADQEEAERTDEPEGDADDDGSNDPFWDEDGAGGEEEHEEHPKETDQHYWAKIAGIICNEKGFWKFIFASNKEEAAVKLRQRCGIESRRELDSNQGALIKFKDLRAEYAVWLDGG